MKKDTIPIKNFVVPIKNFVGFGFQNLTSSKSGLVSKTLQVLNRDLKTCLAGRQEIKLEGIPLQTYHP